MQKLAEKTLSKQVQIKIEEFLKAYTRGSQVVAKSALLLDTVVSAGNILEHSR